MAFPVSSVPHTQVYGLNIYAPTANAFVESLTHKGDNISGWGPWQMLTSCEWNPHKGGHCPERSPTLSALWGYKEKSGTRKRALTQPGRHPDLRLSDSRIMSDTFLLLINHPVCAKSSLNILRHHGLPSYIQENPSHSIISVKISECTFRRYSFCSKT